MTVDPASAAIADAILAMAQRLKLDVIAEGVETEVQLAALRAGGCHQAQGYLFFKPRSPEELTPVLREQQLRTPLPDASAA